MVKKARTVRAPENAHLLEGHLELYSSVKECSEYDDKIVFLDNSQFWSDLSKLQCKIMAGIIRIDDKDDEKSRSSSPNFGSNFFNMFQAANVTGPPTLTLSGNLSHFEKAGLVTINFRDKNPNFEVSCEGKCTRLVNI